MRLLLDTDLGTDVDDALALAVLFGSPEIELSAVTTVYGDTLMRSRMVSQLARLAGRRVGVVPGASTPLSGRAVWLSGAEESGWTDLDSEPVHPAPPRGSALEVLGIGPLTNLALALRRDPWFAGDVTRVHLMGGLFGPGGTSPAAGSEPEHNFASDAVAAHEVFASGLPITVMGLEITRQVRLDAADVASLEGSPAGDLLARQTRAWMAYRDELHDVPHDAVTAVSLVRPELFTYADAIVTVDRGPDPADAGRCRVASGSAHRVVTGLDVGAVTAQVLARIRRGTGLA